MTDRVPFKPLQGWLLKGIQIRGPPPLPSPLEKGQDARCSHTTIMSNFPMPENLLKHIENLLTALPQEIETYSKLPKASLGPVKQLLAKFNGNPLIALLTAAPPA